MSILKAVVLLSGGIDSTTCLAMAVAELGKDNVTALSITYGQKHVKELECAKKIAEYFGVDHKFADVSAVFQFSNCPLLANSTEEIKHVSYADQLAAMGGEGTVDTYVPFRNGLMISCAASLALSLGARRIYYGAHADDAAGRAYPDCTPEFFTAMSEALFEGSGHDLSLWAPLLHKNKAEVVRMGMMCDAPYQLTWSCYEGGDKPCGVCGTCIDRKAAFASNGLEDPVSYATDETFPFVDQRAFE